MDDASIGRHIDSAFSCRPPNGAQSQAQDHLRSEGKRLAHAIVKALPECEDRDRAVEHVRLAVMLANEAVTCPR